MTQLRSTFFHSNDAIQSKNKIYLLKSCKMSVVDHLDVDGLKDETQLRSPRVFSADSSERPTILFSIHQFSVIKKT